MPLRTKNASPHTARRRRKRISVRHILSCEGRGNNDSGGRPGFLTDDRSIGLQLRDSAGLRPRKECDGRHRLRHFCPFHPGNGHLSL